MWRGDSFLRDFVSLREAMDRLFEESFVSPTRLSLRSGATRSMPLEIYETGEELVVRALLPGVTQDDLDIRYQDGVLTLYARSQSAGDHDDWTWHVREIPYGEVQRTISLPKVIDVDEARAEFVDGVLTLHLPKTEQAKPRQIRIGTGESQAQLTSGQTA
jgi:HSP20 family protein